MHRRYSLDVKITRFRVIHAMNMTFKHHAYKVALKPTSEQIKIVKRTMGVCRYVYNLFIATNRSNYTQGTTGYMSGYDFSKWLNHGYRTANPDKTWIWEVSSKAVKKAIMNADIAYKNFMKGRAGFPKFKRRNGRPVSMYLPRNNVGDLTIERHRGKIPTLGWVRFKEYGYIPCGEQPISVTITCRAGRYYASFVFEAEQSIKALPEQTKGIGIDLGIKSFAVVSDGRYFHNVNYTPRMRRLKRRLKHEQRKFMRKLRHRKEETATPRANLDKQRLKVQRAYMKLSNKRQDYIKKAVHEIVSTQPQYITIEDLNVSGMMKNRHLSRAIAECEFYYFRAMLERKCRERSIQFRIADRYYASSKTCSRCGHMKRDLKLSERMYVCEHCGLVMDRDKNAAENLRECVKYATAG